MCGLAEQVEFLHALVIGDARHSLSSFASRQNILTLICLGKLKSRLSLEPKLKLFFYFILNFCLIK